MQWDYQYGRHGMSSRRDVKKPEAWNELNKTKLDNEISALTAYD